MKTLFLAASALFLSAQSALAQLTVNCWLDSYSITLGQGIGIHTTAGPAGQVVYHGIEASTDGGNTWMNWSVFNDSGGTQQDMWVAPNMAVTYTIRAYVAGSDMVATCSPWVTLTVSNPPPLPPLAVDCWLDSYNITLGQAIGIHTTAGPAGQVVYHGIESSTDGGNTWMNWSVFNDSGGTQQNMWVAPNMAVTYTIRAYAARSDMVATCSQWVTLTVNNPPPVTVNMSLSNQWINAGQGTCVYSTAGPTGQVVYHGIECSGDNGNTWSNVGVWNDSGGSQQTGWLYPPAGTYQIRCYASSGGAGTYAGPVSLTVNPINQPQTIWSSNVPSHQYTDPFTPQYGGGAGAGHWQFCLSGYTGWDITSPFPIGDVGTAVTNSAGGSTFWTNAVLGGWWGSTLPAGDITFWIQKDGDQNYAPTPPVGPYTLYVNGPVNGITWTGTYNGITNGICMPSSGFIGQTITFPITVYNSGSNPWVANDPNGHNHYIRVLGPLNDSYFPCIGNTAIGQSITVYCQLTLPSTAGTYTYDFTALQQNVNYFGGTQTAQVTVYDPPPSTSLTVLSSGPYQVGDTFTLQSTTTSPNGNLSSQAIDVIPPGINQSWVGGTEGAGTRWDHDPNSNPVGANTITSHIVLSSAGTWTFRARGQDSALNLGDFVFSNITVNNPPAVSAAISASPSSGTAPASSTISWSSANATSVSVAGPNGFNSSSASGSPSVGPFSAGTYTYTITAQGFGGPVTQNATFTVNNPSAVSAAISASPSSGTAPASSTISWSSANATSVSVAGPNGFNSSSANGSPSVGPFSAGTYTYTITAQGFGGPVTQNATFTVTAALLPQTVSLSPQSESIATGMSVTFSASGGQNGYVWSGGPTGSSGIQTLTFNTAGGPYSISVYSPSGNGYSQSNTPTVNITVVNPTTDPNNQNTQLRILVPTP